MLEAMSDDVTIGVLVDEAMQRRLRHAAPYLHFAMHKDWLELAFFDLESAPSAFVVDPIVAGGEYETEILVRLGERRQAPVILYTRMRPDVASLLLKIGQSQFVPGFRDVLCFGVDDEPERIRSVLASTLLGVMAVG
jgi:hypothetical protein